jgi:hypothetical protein
VDRRDGLVLSEKRKMCYVCTFQRKLEAPKRKTVMISFECKGENDNRVRSEKWDH